MNQEKLEKYELQGSFHTLTVKTTGLIENGNKEFREVIKSNSNTDGETTTTSNLTYCHGIGASFFKCNLYTILINSFKKSENSFPKITKNVKAQDIVFYSLYTHNSFSDK